MMEKLVFIKNNQRRGGKNMSVQGIQSHAIYQSPQEIRNIQKQEPVVAPAAPDDKTAKLSGKSAYDEYIPGEETQPTGLYKVMFDDEGNPKIHFDDPIKKPAEGSSPMGTEEPLKEAEPAKSEPGRKLRN